MMKKKYLYLLLLFPMSNDIAAQQCTETCDTILEKVLIKPEFKRFVPIPNTYNADYETIMISPESKQRVWKPAVFDTISETYLIHPEIRQSFDIQSLPDSCFEIVTEMTVVGTDTKRMIQIPAEYESVTKIYEETVRKIKKPAYQKEETIPATICTSTKKVLKCPDTYKEKVIPAEYKTIFRQVVKTPAMWVDETILAQYRTITKPIKKRPIKIIEEVIPAEYKLVKRVVQKASIVQIAPTFVNDLLQIEGAKRYQIVNLAGQVVLQGSESSVHLKHLTAGMYIVRGQDAAGKFFTTKIVKE